MSDEHDDNRMLRVKRAFFNHEFSRVIQILNAHAAFCKYDGATFLTRGIASAELQRWHRARRCFQRKVELDGTNDQVSTFLATTDFRCGDFDNALIEAKMVASRNRDAAPPHILLGMIYSSCSNTTIRDPGLAIHHSKLAVDLAGPQEIASAFFALSTSHAARGDFNAAIASATKALAESPSHRIGRIQRALSAYQRGHRFIEKAQSFDKEEGIYEQLSAALRNAWSTLPPDSVWNGHLGGAKLKNLVSCMTDSDWTAPEDSAPRWQVISRESGVGLPLIELFFQYLSMLKLY